MLGFTSLATACLLAGGVVGVSEESGEPHRTHYVDAIELNHVYTEEGREVLRQLILWDFDDDRCHWRVGYYRIVGTLDNPNAPAVRRHAGRWRVTLPANNSTSGVFADDGTLTVIASNFHETHTLVDPEVENRREFSEVKRRGLPVRGRLGAKLGSPR